MMKINRPTLREIQEQFAESLFLGDINTNLFSTSQNLANSRFDFYRSNMHANYFASLKNAFPVMYLLVGQDFFELLVSHYVEKYPSQSGDLTVFGRLFSQYLIEEEQVFNYPYFTDVAAIEWLVHLTYYAADSETLSLSDYLQYAGDYVQQSYLVFKPSSILFDSTWNAAGIWLAHQREEVTDLQDEINQACFSLIHRDDWRVNVQMLEKSSYLALKSLQEGNTLEAALELAMEYDQDFNVAKHLQHWFSLNIFSHFICKD